MPAPGRRVGGHDEGMDSQSCPKDARDRYSFREACWSQGTLEQCLPRGPGARGVFQGQAGDLQKGLHLNLELGKSAGVLDFLLKTMGIQRSF